MGCPFESFSVGIRSDNARVASWALSQNCTYPLNFVLVVQNSREGDRWEDLSEDVKNACFFVDDRRRNWNKNMNEYYRLKLEAEGEIYYSDIVKAGITNVFPFSSEAKEAISNVEMAIKMSGVTGVLLKKKVWGERCPLCTDFAGQASVNEHCPKCLGTGIVGGYYPGISLSIVKDKIEWAAANGQLGGIQSEKVSGRCVAYPWITNGDIWCEDGTNKRYSISVCTPSASYKTVPLVYTVIMSKMEYTDALYTKEATELVDNKDIWQAKNDAYSAPTGTSNSKWEGALE